MRLRYIQNMYWYDGPLLDLYIVDEGSFDLYFATSFIETKEETIWLVRKHDDSVKIEPGIGVIYDKDFWEFKKNLDVDYFLMPDENIIQGKSSYDRVPFLAFDVVKMTDEQRTELDFKFDFR